jgi:broad specificity phosphatase PhoE
MNRIQRTIWLLRHGLRRDFVDRGWAIAAARPHDTPLAREGRIQSLDTARFLADKGVQVIYASPFLRTVETACYIAEQLGVPVRVENGMCEMFKAEWFPKEPDFLPVMTLKDRFPMLDETYAARVHPTYPERDGHDDLEARCAATVNALLADDWSCALWVGHGASVGGVAMGLTGTTSDVCFKMCGLTGWTGSPGAWRQVYSGTGHLSITEDDAAFHPDQLKP